MIVSVVLPPAGGVAVLVFVSFVVVSLAVLRYFMMISRFACGLYLFWHSRHIFFCFITELIAASTSAVDVVNMAANESPRAPHLSPLYSDNYFSRLTTIRIPG